MKTMTLTRTQADTIFLGLGFTSAPTWEASKMTRMVNVLAKQYDAEALEEDIENTNTLKLAMDVLKFLTKKGKVIVKKRESKESESRLSKNRTALRESK